MKRIGRDEILSATARKSLLKPARAAEILYAAEQFLIEKLGSAFFYKPRVWKNGTLRIAVENSITAQKVYGESEPLLEFLREKFPEYRFRDVRTEIVMREE